MTGEEALEPTEWIDGSGYFDAPVFDIVADPTGRHPSIRLCHSGTIDELDAAGARRLAGYLNAAADLIDPSAVS